MDTSRGRRPWGLTVGLLLLLLPGGFAWSTPGAPAEAEAELDPATSAAFDTYVSEATAAFERRIDESPGLWGLADRERSERLRDGHVVAAAGRGDGIHEVPGGLVHHWVATVFLPGQPLATVLAQERDYAGFPQVFAPVVEAELVAREGDVDRVRLRLEQETTFVHVVLDTWWVRRHRLDAPDRVHILATTDRIQQIERAGTPDEHRLPEGEGGGYLWRAASFTTLVEHDGGTYVELETIGLSRRFPRMLGWLVGPIARRVGRGSVEQTLDELRAAIEEREDARPADVLAGSGHAGLWASSGWSVPLADGQIR